MKFICREFYYTPTTVIIINNDKNHSSEIRKFFRIAGEVEYIIL